MDFECKVLKLILCSVFSLLLLLLWSNGWDIVEVHHVGPEGLHLLEVL